MHILISALSRFTQPTGICRHTANLARCLSDLPQIRKITLVLGKWQEEYFRTAFNIASDKLELVPIAIPNHSLARNRWFCFELPRVTSRYRPDIVHLGFPVPVFRSRFACPVVATVHDLYPFDFPESFAVLNGFGKRMFIRRCMQACDAVACVSEATRSSLDRFFPHLSSRVPVRLVHNYADFSRAAAVAPVGADPRPFLLTVAQHQPNKRLDVLLRAFARLRTDGLVSGQLRLLMVGSPGSQTESLGQLAQSLQLGDCVHWLPPLPDGQLAWLYQNCEAFIASSCIEGFCLPLLEALWFDCRVVASDIPVFREIIGDGAHFFDIRRTPAENLAASIARVLELPRTVDRATLRFSRKTTAAECLSLYSTLLPGQAVNENGPVPVFHSAGGL